ncbi:hypothetical protein N7510_011461 [Penicillium lagena]|uniref:uncharacterized protein n=1 Tax=Penicillium lagena TaxID=94218 RepID=UPI0025411C6C|nr:uncharacterized protein N7510_011461 [Penicillium lagena]KAJ5601927.1 hypothetical protein N7510_011461 [Penicillium lagena]
MTALIPPQGVKRGDYVEVAHPLEGRGGDELTLRKGDQIELLELDDEYGDGWYLGRQLRTSKIGLFPAVYLMGATASAIASETTESPIQMDTPALPTSFAPASGETTPQASRHTSTSDIQGPQLDSETPQPSPRQPTQRATSSPLPSRPNLAADMQAFRTSMDNHINGEESPVMNETLSVIDEHITDMNTPRHSLSMAQETKPGNDSGSEYSSHLSHRISYINGHETDEEESSQPTEAEVRKWSQKETARYMRGLGVDPKHCEIFDEQEITGDVLLDMDQDFIFMKEFDFGVMGKRLKTWHKVKAFQEEIKRPKIQPTRISRGSSFSGPQDERTLSRAGHTGPLLPRIPSLAEKSNTYPSPRALPAQHPRLASNNSSPIGTHTPTFGQDSSRRVSAASIRELNHARRHSSIDSTNRGDMSHNGYHQNKASLDRSWTLNTSAQGLPTRPGTSMGTTTEGIQRFRGPLTTESDSPVSAPEPYDDFDRGYFSGTDADPRRNRRVLQKRTSLAGSASHSRKSSYADDPYRVKGASKRHSRINSLDSLRDATRDVTSASQAYNAVPSKSRFRSLSHRVSERNADGKSNHGFFSSFAPLVGRGDSDSSPRSSTSHLQQSFKNAGPKFRRAVGLRAISDIVGKSPDTSAPASPRDYDPTSTTTRTGSTTPSATSKSSERHSTDGSGKAAEGAGFMIRPRTVKTKKDTSAYRSGLEKKGPLEQMDGCDYSGWMKKRSSNLMTTWKPRLFILRGRRLSYYYSDTDTEERGLIDITAHRVLRADNDPIITLHATFTGSTAMSMAPSPTSPTDNTSKILPSGMMISPANFFLKEGQKPFFFKLVPPKTGNSRTVQFTKPAVHYFQVDNVKEGRKWMAALMKATIERDLDQIVETTNKQKTISLKQAQLMNQRPPALLDGPAKLDDETPSINEDDETWHEVDKPDVDKPDVDKPDVDKPDVDKPLPGVDPKEDDEDKDEVENEQESVLKDAHRPMSNPLGSLGDTGPSSLLPERLMKTGSH